MPDKAPGVADTPRDTGTELDQLNTRVTNLENAVGRLNGEQHHEDEPGAPSGQAEAPQLAEPPEGATSS